MTAKTRRRRRNGARSTPDNAPPRFIGYVRVSSREQAENGVSLVAQRDRLEAWAKAHDYELVRIARDSGISGTVAPNKRPGLAGALEAIRKGHADGLAAIKLDRISRSVRDTLNLAETFERQGWLLATVQENIDTTSATGRLFLNLLASMAQWERETISERTTAGLDAIAREGRSRSRFTPYGWRTGRGISKTAKGDRSLLVKHPGEQKTLRRMSRLRDRDESGQAIADKINAEGHRTRNGREWTRQVVWRTLRRFDDREAVIDG